MKSWPKESDLSPDLHDGVAKGRPGSTDRLLIWLLEHFSGLADPDHVDDCLLNLARRMTLGFRPRCPVRWFRLLLYFRECREYRDKKEARRNVCEDRKAGHACA